MHATMTHLTIAGRTYTASESAPGVWEVQEDAPDAELYFVNLERGTCTCPAAKYRRGPCKHTLAVRELLPKEEPVQQADRTWHAWVTRQLEFIPGILHLSDLSRGNSIPLSSPADIDHYLAEHPEVGSVMIYDSRFPRGAVALEVFREKWAAKLWR